MFSKTSKISVSPLPAIFRHVFFLYLLILLRIPPALLFLLTTEGKHWGNVLQAPPSQDMFVLVWLIRIQIYLHTSLLFFAHTDKCSWMQKQYFVKVLKVYSLSVRTKEKLQVLLLPSSLFYWLFIETATYCVRHQRQQQIVLLIILFPPLKGHFLKVCLNVLQGKCVSG